jgi:hypothetical protein
MGPDFVKVAAFNGLKGLGNTLLNGFRSDLSKKDRVKLIGIKCAHFNPYSKWKVKRWSIVDQTTGEKYNNDSKTVIRRKSAAVFGVVIAVQPIALLLNVINRIGKILTFAHFWNPSKEKYSFSARLTEWAMDILRVVLTPIIYLGMLFGALLGATCSPHNGRKIYATWERFTFSGGYQFFRIDPSQKLPHSWLIAPCFQPEPKVHLGGGKMGLPDVW